MNYNSYPKISIVTVSYNQDAFLEETILSVINQDYDNIEYIIIDGGSTDNSIDIIKKYEKFITYWVSEKDNGPADALNKGLKKTTGDIFYYLNSDDVLIENSLSRVVSLINSYPDYHVYYGHGIVRNEIHNFESKIYSSKWSPAILSYGGVSIIQQATFFNLAFIKKNDIYFNISNKTCWDGEILVDLYLNNARFKRFNFSEILGVFRLHGTSISGTNANFQRYQNDHLRLLKKLNLTNNTGFFSFIKLLLNDPKLYFFRFVSKFMKSVHVK